MVSPMPHAGETLVSAPDRLIGTRIDRYRILERIGEGGMASVYAVEHQLLRRRMAMKILQPALAEQGSFAARFHNEAIAASRVRHPNVVEVTDFGWSAEGLPYLVMEELQGRALDQVLAAGPFGVARALRVATQVARGLAAAHAAGVVHRYLKPANVILGGSDEHEIAKVLDFGISKLLAEGPHLTSLGSVLGTPQYMAPEQAAGRAVDQRADVYALGILLYELLAGRPPFLDPNPVQVLMMQQTAAPRPLAELRPDVPASLEAFVMRTLAKDPGARPSSMEACVRTLEDLGRVAPVTAPPRPVDARRFSLADPVPATLALEPTEAYVASRLAGGSLTEHELVQVSGLPPAQAVAIIERLLAKGVLAEPRAPGAAIAPIRLVPTAVHHSFSERVPGPSRQSKRQAALQTADELEAAGQFGEAVVALKSSLSLDPFGSDNGWIEHRIRQLESALAAIDFKRGRQQDAQGHYQEAAAAYERAVAHNPRSAAYLEAAARKRLYEGRDGAAALRFATLAASLAPGDCEAHATLARAYLAVGQWVQAAAEVDRALRIDPKRRFAKSLKRKVEKAQPR